MNMMMKINAECIGEEKAEESDDESTRVTEGR